MAFSASAFAVDVKFSGDFYAGGMYQDKVTFKKDTASDGPSAALYFQRLRLRTDLVVSPGLTLVTRADIMERAWGQVRSTPGTALDAQSQGTTAENENIAFDLAYVAYTSPIGIFGVGYQMESTWGTVFANSNTSIPKITYTGVFGPSTVLIQLVQASEGSNTKKVASTADDADSSSLYLMYIYNWKGGNAGLLYVFGRNASTRPASNYQGQLHILEPYVKAQFGPIAIQAELDYAFGKARKYDETSLGTDVDYDSWAGYFDLVATFGPVYFGGTFAYVQGQGTDATKVNAAFSGGTDWEPCLLMFNYTRYYWLGSIAGNDTTTQASPMTNAMFYQLKGGVKPTEKLDIFASVSYANADKKGTASNNDAYGWEIDVTGTYKITNNLSYMLGVGYFMTGDYYKGTTAGTSVRNDFLVINKLTLTF